MADFKMRIVSIFLILGTVYNTVESAPTEQNYSQVNETSENIAKFFQNLQNGISKLDVLFAKLIRDDLKPEQNALFSSLNIYTALSLLQLGTNGGTRDELSKTLEIPVDETGLARAHSYLGKLLNDFQTTKAAEIKIGNSIFIQKGTKLKDSYLQATKNYYKNEAQEVDFAKGGPEATDIINEWVSSNTKKRIPKLFKNEISPATQLLLASSLFFNATWQKPFQKWATKNEKFHTGVREVEVATMNQKANIPYLNSVDLQVEAISIPYDRQEFNMIVILPYKNHSVGAFIDQFSVQKYEQAIKEFSSPSGSSYRYVDYKIPRLKYGWSQSINNYVIKAGVKKIFADAELDNMVENSSSLQVSDISHATEIQVDEDGTIATAVTTVGVTRTSLELHPEPIKFYVDRPFSFSIYHKKSGITLFTGIVQNPSV